MSMKIHSYARNKILYGIPNKLARFVPKEMVAMGLREDNIVLPEITIGTISQEIKRYGFESDIYEGSPIS
jgi:hypothetical protein